jgi:SAM-dependent methyltransferase
MSELPVARSQSEIATAYDVVAASYADRLEGALAGQPWDRAMLSAFADLVRAGGLGPVADVGCGPGRITTYLSGLGLDVFGVDLSPGMVAQARERHPGLTFTLGALPALALADGSLGGVVAWYSVIHTPPERQGAVYAELSRVVAPGGHVLLAFQVGDEHRVVLDEAYGHAISLDVYRLSPDLVARRLSDVGLVVQARLVREPGERERTQQAYLLGRKPSVRPSPAAIVGGSS